MTWSVAVRAGADRPLTGYGPDVFAIVNRKFKSPEAVAEFGDGIIQASAHNSILQAWATMGGPGVLALIWLIVATWRRLWIDSVMEDIFVTTSFGVGRITDVQVNGVSHVEGADYATAIDDSEQDIGAAPAFGALVALVAVSMFNPVPPMSIYLVAAMTASVLRVRE